MLFGTHYAVRFWVPSPLAGEGQEEGAAVRRLRLPRFTLSLALSHQGRGEKTEEQSKFVPNTIAGEEPKVRAVPLTPLLRRVRRQSYT